ncbi:unnamed protein product [Sphagnum compactum]
MKQYRRGIIFTSKFAKLAKHLSKKLETEISNHGYPYVIDIALDVEISYQHTLGSGSFGTVFKCTFLGVVAAAKANNVLINVLEGPDGQLSSSSVQAKLTDFGQSKLKLHDSGYTTPMVLKMLCKDSDGEEGISTGGNSRPLYIADATYVKHRARNLVHEGGWSNVYRGELKDGRLLAIERPNDSESQELLLTGGLEINSCLSHANIVPLIGYCVKNTQLILVYDFLHRQTLGDHLYGEENVLGWEVRYKVAVGICKALEYLQDGSPQSVIHRDVKPSNILLSHDFRPQLSGFVLATWAAESPMYQWDGVVGTIGYIDPEYFTSGTAGDKSDVYSFGVVLLELITGRKPIDFSRSTDGTLQNWARRLLCEGNLNELVDPRLGSTYNVSQMQAMLSAAALCVQNSSQQRPKISEVLKMLIEIKDFFLEGLVYWGDSGISDICLECLVDSPDSAISDNTRNIDLSEF